MRFASTGSRDACRSCRRREPGTLAAALGAGSPGFSLLEVLAALTILAMGLSALYGSFGSAIRASDRSGERLVAVQLAQSLLEQHTAGRAFGDRVMRGRQGSYQWVVTVEPVEDEARPALSGPQPSQPASPWQLQQIAVTVTWPRERRFQLETLHLARAP